MDIFAAIVKKSQVEAGQSVNGKQVVDESYIWVDGEWKFSRQGESILVHIFCAYILIP